MIVEIIDLNNPRSQPTIPGWLPLAEKHNSFGVADLFQQGGRRVPLRLPLTMVR
jgi:hypothetical protein